MLSMHTCRNLLLHASICNQLALVRNALTLLFSRLWGSFAALDTYISFNASCVYCYYFWLYTLQTGALYLWSGSRKCISRSLLKQQINGRVCVQVELSRCHSYCTILSTVSVVISYIMCLRTQCMKRLMKANRSRIESPNQLPHNTQCMKILNRLMETNRSRRKSPNQLPHSSRKPLPHNRK